MRILSTGVDVSTKHIYYIQIPDRNGEPRTVQVTIPTAGSVTLWGRCAPDAAWVDLVDFTSSDIQPVKLLSEMAATVTGVTAATTVTVDIDVAQETPWLNGK